MKDTELVALTGFIATIAPIMQTHPAGGVAAAIVVLVYAAIQRWHGE